MIKIGILIGCVISLILFVLVMKMILPIVGSMNWKQKEYHSANEGFYGQCNAHLRVKIRHEHHEIHLQVFFSWESMRIKLSKCHHLSLMKGMVKEIKFFNNGNKIPTIFEKSIKSLIATPYLLMITITVKMSWNNW